MMLIGKNASFKGAQNAVTELFFFQCLSAFVHEHPAPPLDSAVSTAHLLRRIRQHHLGAVFALCLRQDDLNDFLNTEAHRRAQRYLNMMSEMTSVITCMRQHAIEPVVLKGIPLNSQLYGHRCLREMNDLDVLIPSEALMRSHQCLLDLGYQFKSQIQVIDLVNDYTFLMNYCSELLYWHPIKKVAIDLKWQLSPLHTFLSHWFVPDNLQSMERFNEPVRILKNEQNFVYLCIHASQHGWEHLKWLLDLAMFDKKIHLHWPQVIRLAQEAHAIRSLLEASLLLKQVFAIQKETVPHCMMDKIAVVLRVYFITRQWKKGPWKQNKVASYLLCVLNLLLYADWMQKRHYVLRLFLLRVKSLNQIGLMARPMPWKMIWRSWTRH